MFRCSDHFTNLFQNVFQFTGTSEHSKVLPMSCRIVILTSDPKSISPTPSLNFMRLFQSCFVLMVHSCYIQSVKIDRSLSRPCFWLFNCYIRLEVLGLWDFCTLCHQFSEPSVGKDIWPFLYNILVILALSRTPKPKNHTDLYLFILWMKCMK